jgi:hypothetical protein
VGITHQVDDTTGVAVAVWDGEITPADVDRHLTNLERDQHWARAAAYITDLRTVAASSVPDDDAVSALAVDFRTRLRARMGSARWAFVAGGLFEQLLVFGMHVEGDPSSIVTFSRLEPACAWVGVGYEGTRDVVRRLRDQLRAFDAVPTTTG